MSQIRVIGRRGQLLLGLLDPDPDGGGSGKQRQKPLTSSRKLYPGGQQALCSQDIFGSSQFQYS